jgi:putative flippase GtrA
MQAGEETSPRLRVGLLRHHTVRQLVKFGLVGATGFVINVSVFAFSLRVLDVHYRLAYVFAFCVAVTSNFVWNRVWTFRHEKDDSHVALQASRFFAVSLLAAVGGLVLLEAFVRSGMPKIPGEMLAVLLVVPISFLGNKHWSFR